MKIFKSKTYKQAMQEISYQKIFDDTLVKNNGDKRKAAEMVLDLATGGMWAVWDQEKIDKAIQTILGQFTKKNTIASKNKQAQVKGFVRIQPSDKGEGLYDVAVSTYKNPNLGSQGLKSGLGLEEAERIAAKLVERWGYELIKEDLSTNQRYNKWLEDGRDGQVITNKKIAQVKPNPLDGKSNQQARNIVNRKIIPQEQIKGFFTDDSWQGIQQIWNAFNEAGLDWNIMGSDYYPTSDGHPMGGKIWQVEVNFINNKGKPTKLGGTVTAAGAGTVEDPLSRYDITAYIG